MFKKNFLKSFIGSKVKVLVLDYDNEYIVDKDLSIFTNEDYEYYSADNFLLVDHEIKLDVAIFYMGYYGDNNIDW